MMLPTQLAIIEVIIYLLC